MTQIVTLDWSRFSSLTAARTVFWTKPCVYVQTDLLACPVRVGMASKGLNARYRGGTAYTIDAAMHDSKNLVFVVEVPSDCCALIEKNLIWQYRKLLIYNNMGKRNCPEVSMRFVHEGEAPSFDDA